MISKMLCYLFLYYIYLALLMLFKTVKIEIFIEHHRVPKVCGFVVLYMGQQICSRSLFLLGYVVSGVLDIPMISWVVMLVSRLLDYVATIEDEGSGGKKHLGGKERERTFTGM